ACDLQRPCQSRLPDRDCRHRRSVVVKVTVLDDYQHAFEGTEAIQRLRQKLRVEILTEKNPTEKALIRAHKGLKAIIATRERTKFPAALLQALTDLEI